MSTDTPTLEDFADPIENHRRTRRQMLDDAGAVYGRNRTSPDADTAHVPRCGHCDTELSAFVETGDATSMREVRELARVFGTAANVVAGCPECVTDAHRRPPDDLLSAIKIAMQDHSRVQEALL